MLNNQIKFRIMRKILLSQLLILLLLTGIHAQTWTNYRTSNTSTTLPNNFVTCMINAGDELMWVGTDDGLASYDGTNWTVFTSENSNLSNNLINGLEVDGQGRIWVAQDDGVSIYQNNDFTNISYGDGLNAYYAECLDFNKETGDMWIGYGHSPKGITRYDGENFTHYTTADGLGYDKVYTIEADTSGNVWCGFGKNSYGVSVFNGSTWQTFTTSDGLSSDKVYDIHVDDSGSVWLATSAGISKYKNNSWSVISEINGQVLDFVFSINQDQDGDLWFGVNSNNIYEYNGSSWNDYQIPDFTSTNWFNGIIPFKGNMWFATGPGIVEYDGVNWTQHRITSAMETNVIGNVFVASDNAKYFGYYNRLGFARFKNGEWFTSDGTSSITSACEDSSGAIWFGCTFALYKYENDTFTYYTTSDGLSSNDVYDVCIDKDNVLWAATANGITRYDGKNWSTYHASDGLLSNGVQTIEADSNGNIWCGYGYRGLGATFFDGVSFTNYTTADGLINNSVNDIKIDDNGNVWFGTNEGGVSRFDGSAWTSYTTANGLSDNAINSMAINDTIVWCATDEGISKFDNSVWTKYNESNSGLLENWVWTIAADKYNNVWMGFGSSGLGVQKFGLPESRLHVADTIFIANEEGSAAKLNIYSNTVWQVSSGEPWLVTDQTSGRDTATITLTAESNPVDLRYTVLTVSCPDAEDKQVIVVQSNNIRPEEFLSFSEDTLVIESSEGSSETFSIYSNASWNIGSNESWLSVNPFAGQDTSVITVTAQANTTTNDRYAELSLTTGELNNYKLVVRQLSGVTGIFEKTKANSEFNITLQSENLLIGADNDLIHELEIYDISGKLIFKEKFNNNITVNISQWNNGIYILKIHSKSGTLTNKIIF